MEELSLKIDHNRSRYFVAGRRPRRTEQFMIRMTIQEKRELDDMASIVGVSSSELIRLLIRDEKIRMQGGVSPSSEIAMPEHSNEERDPTDDVLAYRDVEVI